MKDGIRRKGDRRKKSKKEKEKRKETICIQRRGKAAYHKTPRFRLYGIFGEKGRIIRIDVISLLVA